MSGYQNETPVPPDGTAPYTPPADAAAATDADNEKRKKDKKKEKRGGFGTSFLGGVLGALVVAIVLMALWAYTPLFGGSNDSSEGGSSTITINNTEDTTTAEAVAAKVTDSVVTIYVYSDSSSWSEYFGGSDSSSTNSPSALGSGVIIKCEDGYAYILTNYHVVEDISRATVTVGDNTYEAEAVGSDEDSDLAVIRIQADGLTAIDWGDSSNLSVGEWVMAVGSPYGYENTCTTGIVSALYRSDVLSDSTGLGTTIYTDMIQTDAAINPGNSGGALVNAEGQLIGINTYISTESSSSAGLGFAIPSNDAKEVAEQLMSGETVDHAYLGVSLNDSTDPAGAEVAAVYKDTAAANAGLQTGDIITKFGDTTISSASDLTVAVNEHNVGETITITYVRNGAEATTDATLGSDSTGNTSEYAENGSPESGTDSNSGSGGGSDGNGYYYYDNSGSDGSSGSSDLYGWLNEMFGGSSSGDSSSSGGSFWE